MLLYEGQKYKEEKRLFTASPVVSQLVHQQLHLHILQQFDLLVQQFDLSYAGREAIVLVNSIFTVERFVRIASSELSTLNGELSTTTENLQLSSRYTTTHSLTNSTFTSIDMKVCKFRQTVDELSYCDIRRKVNVISSGQNILTVLSTTIRRKCSIKCETIANSVNAFVNANTQQFGCNNSIGFDRLSCHNNITCSCSTSISINDSRIATTTSRCITTMPNSLLLLYEGIKTEIALSGCIVPTMLPICTVHLSVFL